MPQFQVTVKQMKNSNNLRIEKGMSVSVVTNYMTNPLTTNNGQDIVDAFIRIYGVDLNDIGALSTVYLNVEEL